MVKHGGRRRDIFFRRARLLFHVRAEEVDRDERRAAWHRLQIMRAGIKRWPVGGPIQTDACIARYHRQHASRPPTSRKSFARSPTRNSKSQTTGLAGYFVQHLLSVMSSTATSRSKSAHSFRRMPTQVLAVRQRRRSGRRSGSDGRATPLALCDGSGLKDAACSTIKRWRPSSSENPLTPRKKTTSARP